MEAINKKKLASSAFTVLIFAFTLVFALWTASRAWFSDDDSVRGRGMGVRAEVADTIVTTWEMYEMNTNDGSTLSFKQTPIVADQSNPAAAIMPQYNADNPTDIYRLLHIHLAIKEGSSIQVLPNLSVTAQTEVNYFMSGNNYPLLGNNETHKDYHNSISSIICFADVTDFFNINNYSVPIPEKTESFVNTDSVAEYTIHDTPRRLGTVAGGEATADVYILIAYDDMLISRVFAENIGREATAQGNVQFVNDFEFVLTSNPTSDSTP